MADIELVIKIPEKWFDDMVREEFTEVDELCAVIQHGTPLPKGHGRLIEDTPELECELWTYTRYTGIDEAPYESAVKVIDEAPTIIAACTLAEADGGDEE